MKIENSYPKLSKEINHFILLRRLILIFFFVSSITCVIINYSLGGVKWCFYVIFGELLFYFAFLNKPLVDNLLVKRLSILMFIVSGYMYAIDLINQTNWSIFVIDILVFVILIMQLLFFFIDYKYHKEKIVIMVFTSFVSLILFAFAIFKIIPINWPIIVVASLGIITLIILFSFYVKTTLLELKKYFNLR